MHKLGERAVHVNHAILRRGLDNGAYFVGARVANECAYRIVVDKEFVGRNEPARDARDESLGEDADQGARELHAHLRLLFGREHVNDAINGLRGIVGVQS